MPTNNRNFPSTHTHKFEISVLSHKKEKLVGFLSLCAHILQFTHVFRNKFVFSFYFFVFIDFCVYYLVNGNVISSQTYKYSFFYFSTLSMLTQLSRVCTAHTHVVHYIARCGCLNRIPCTWHSFFVALLCFVISFSLKQKWLQRTDLLL